MKEGLVNVALGEGASLDLALSLSFLVFSAIWSPSEYLHAF